MPANQLRCSELAPNSTREETVRRCQGSEAVVGKMSVRQHVLLCESMKQYHLGINTSCAYQIRTDVALLEQALQEG
jgi:hypothetical protein